jgi:hypothetical protein
MRTKFTISSHIDFYEKTYPVIVKSLMDSGVPPEDIYPASLKSIYAGTDPHMVPENWTEI